LGAFLCLLRGGLERIAEVTAPLAQAASVLRVGAAAINAVVGVTIAPALAAVLIVLEHLIVNPVLDAGRAHDLRAGRRERLVAVGAGALFGHGVGSPATGRGPVIAGDAHAFPVSPVFSNGGFSISYLDWQLARISSASSFCP
jgi:hypothetical protein